MPTGLINPAQSTYLDFVRATAAMSVLFGHSAVMFLSEMHFSKMNIQSIGVLVFFLMSGFLISYSVFRKYDDPNYTFKHFFIDRFSRIYCAFLPALIFVWLLDMQTMALPVDSSARIIELTWIPNMSENSNIFTWFGNLFMMQQFPLFQVLRVLGVPDNIYFVKTFGSGSPFWTISIEWWIYMLFGAIAITLVRDRKPITFLFLCILGFLAIEPIYFLVGGTDSCLTFLWLIGMITSLLFINISSILEKYHINFSPRKWKLIYVGIFIAALILMAGRAIDIKLDRSEFILTELQFGIFLSIGVFALLFFFGQITEVPRILRKIISFIADYSYSLYLTHATLITYLYIRYPGHDNDPSFFWLAIIASNVLAIVFWALFERHHRCLSSWMKTKINKRDIA